MKPRSPSNTTSQNIIRSVGELYCTSREDLFLVDLETKHKNFKAGTKFLDITCRYANTAASCAIELKFKTAQQGAQDHGRIDAYVDIETLELACDAGYSFGRFYMITNSTPYVNKSRRGVGTVFAMHHGHVSEPGLYHCPESKGRENVRVNLKGTYSLDWKRVRDWYFLVLDVDPQRWRGRG